MTLFRNWRVACTVTSLIAAGLVFALTAAAAPSSSSQPRATKTITLGLLAPITGNLASDGDVVLKGAKLAVNELNAKGGVAGYKFKLETRDVQSLKPDVVAGAARDFIANKNVKAVFAGFASTNNFEIDLFARAGMPYILGGNSAQTEGIIGKNPSKYPTVWCANSSYDAYFTETPRILAKLAAQSKLTNKRVFLITSSNAYSQTISDGAVKTFEKMGWQLVGNETVPFGTINDWGTVLAKIRETKPAVILNTDYLPGNEAAFLKQFLENPTQSLMYLQYGPSTPDFLKLTGSASTGIMYSIISGPIQSAKWKPAVSAMAKYKKAYGKKSDPGVYGISIYEQVLIYADALRKVKNPDNRAAISRAIGKTVKDTAMGRLKFNPKTHVAVEGEQYIPLQFFEIANGKRLTLFPEKIRTGSYVRPPWLG